VTSLPASTTTPVTLREGADRELAAQAGDVSSRPGKALDVQPELETKRMELLKEMP
jgi:hypothetical protein